MTGLISFNNEASIVKRRACIRLVKKPIVAWVRIQRLSEAVTCAHLLYVPKGA